MQIMVSIENNKVNSRTKKIYIQESELKLIPKTVLKSLHRYPKRDLEVSSQVELDNILSIEGHLMKNHQLKRMIYQKLSCLGIAYITINKRTFLIDSLEIVYIPVILTRLKLILYTIKLKVSLGDNKFLLLSKAII